MIKDRIEIPWLSGCDFTYVVEDCEIDIDRDGEVTDVTLGVVYLMGENGSLDEMKSVPDLIEAYLCKAVERYVYANPGEFARGPDKNESEE